ncbi:MAG: hypothetical protein QOE72_4389 [Chloroflexota bacterium]|jgi:hypothetical protein|nr:hypothetical protein [Chloroflexota bacterium]
MPGVGEPDRVATGGGLDHPVEPSTAQVERTSRVFR